MKILLNVLTHGDETIGLEVVQKISKLNIKKDTLKVNIANKLAYEKGKKYIDSDLNRAFPGNKNGNYEQKLATKIMPLVNKFDLVLDIHSTKSKLKDAVIVTKLDEETKKYINIISPKYVLLMSITKNNALISSAKVGLAFEYGNNDSNLVINKIVSEIKKILIFHNLINNEKKINKNRNKTIIFDVHNEIQKPTGYKLLPNIKNYKLIKKSEIFATDGINNLIASENFYPILFGNNNYNDIFGFAANIID